MKTLLILTSLLLAPLAVAEIKFPRGSFDLAEIAQAKEQAVSSKKHIAYVYTDKDTNCGLCIAATEDYLKAVRSSAVIVYLNSKETKDFWSTLPANLREALTPGKFIPKMVVTSEDGETVLGSVGYEVYSADKRGSIRELQKKLR